MFKLKQTSIKHAALSAAVLALAAGSALDAQAADECTTGRTPDFCLHIENISNPNYLYFYLRIPSWTKPVAAGVGVSHWSVLDGTRRQYELRRYGRSNRSKRAYIRARPGSSYKVQVQMCLRRTLSAGSSCGPSYTFTLVDPISRRVEDTGRFYAYGKIDAEPSALAGCRSGCKIGVESPQPNRGVAQTPLLRD